MAQFLIMHDGPMDPEREAQRALVDVFAQAGVPMQVEHTGSFMVEGDPAIIESVLAAHPRWSQAPFTIANVKAWYARRTTWLE